MSTLVQNSVYPHTASGPSRQIPDDIRLLLDKYRAHRVPPLIELVDRNTIELIHRGFTEMWQVPLAIYWPKGDPGDESSWVTDDSGRIVVTPSTKLDCRSGPPDPRHPWNGCRDRTECDQNDRQFAHLTARRKEPLVYHCHRGFLYLTMPVILEGRVIAVLFTGQFFPAAGASWTQIRIEGSPNELHDNGSCDLHKISVERWNSTQRASGDGEQDPLPTSYLQTQPQELRRYIDGLTKARDALLEAASAKAEMEKYRQRDYFRTWLFEAPRDRGPFWEFLKEWLLAWRLPQGAFLLGIIYDRQPHRVNVELAIGLADFKCGAFEIADTLNWQRLRDFLTQPTPERTFRVAGLLKGFRLPSARVVALAFGKHGVLLYGVRETPLQPDMWDSDHVSARQFVRDMGVLLDQIEKSKAKEEFLQCFSHELRSPIHTALFTIDRIRKGHFTDASELDERCRRLQAQISRLLKVIEGVWQLQTILAGQKLTLNPQRTNLYDFLAYCASQARDMSHRDDVAIVINRETLSGLPAVELDPHAFGLVAFNLLDNAVKYSAKQTEIRVQGRRTGVEIMLSFQSIGIRIPPPAELDVFERFVRTKEAIEKVPHSSGIGLFLAKHIIEAHGGLITATSVPIGRGNHLVTVTVRLPMRQ